MNFSIKILRFLIGILFFSFVTSCSLIPKSDSITPEKLIVGKWSGLDITGKPGTFVFSKNGKATIISQEYIFDNSKPNIKFTWSLDSTKDPMHLDLIMLNTSSGAQRIMPILARFLEKNKLKIRIGGDPKVRPIGFSNTENVNQLVLDRQ